MFAHLVLVCMNLSSFTADRSTDLCALLKCTVNEKFHFILVFKWTLSDTEVEMSHVF